MKLVSVVCRVSENGEDDHLANIEPTQFLDLLSESQESTEADDIAALEAELASARAPKAPAEPRIAPSVPAVQPGKSNGMIVLPRAAVEPLFSAKTRGELIEKLNELLSQFNARLANEGE